MEFISRSSPPCISSWWSFCGPPSWSCFNIRLTFAYQCNLQSIHISRILSSWAAAAALHRAAGWASMQPVPHVSIGNLNAVDFFRSDGEKIRSQQIRHGIWLADRINIAVSPGPPGFNSIYPNPGMLVVCSRTLKPLNLARRLLNAQRIIII